MWRVSLWNCEKANMKSYSENNFYINVFSSIGLLIAIYSYYVKKRFLKDPKNYKAMCDLNDSISCSKVLTSRYLKKKCFIVINTSGSSFRIKIKLYMDIAYKYWFRSQILDKKPNIIRKKFFSLKIYSLAGILTLNTTKLVDLIFIFE